MRVRRTWISVLFTVLAALATLFATVGWWVHETVLDTDRFMELVDPVVTSTAVSEAVGERVTDQVFVSLQVEERVNDSLEDVDDWLRSGLGDLLGLDPQGPIAGGLPDGPRLGDLAPALVGAAHQRVSDRVTEAVSSPRFQQALVRSARTAHVATVAVLREDASAMPDNVVVDGDVTLDLRPMVETALAPVVTDLADLLGLDPEAIPADLRLAELADRLGVEVDPDITTIVLVSEEQLEPWRGAVTAFDRLVWVLVALAILLGIGAVWTAPRRRIGTARLGLGVAVALAITFPLVAVLEAALVGRLASPGARDTLGSVVDAAVGDLQVAAAAIIAVALLATLAAWALERRRTTHPVG